MHLQISASQELQKLRNRKKCEDRVREWEEMRRVSEKYTSQRQKQIKDVQPCKAKKPPLRKASPIKEYTERVRFSQCCAFEPTHGGQILWIVRDTHVDIVDRSGRVLFLIPVPDGTVITQTPRHIWLGTKIGSVHVYDKHTFEEILSHCAHSSAVRCFARGLDDTVFSGSDDGSVAEWRDAFRDVSYLINQISLKFSIVSIVCYGFRLFIATKNGALYEYEAETNELIKEFDTEKDEVRSLICVNGFVCTVHTSQKALAWNIGTGRLHKTLQSSANAQYVEAFADTWNGRLLLVDVHGGISVFDVSEKGDFRYLKKLNAEKEDQIMCIKGVASQSHFNVMIGCSDGRSILFEKRTDKAQQEILSATQILEQRFAELNSDADQVASAHRVCRQNSQMLREQLAESLNAKVRRAKFAAILKLLLLYAEWYIRMQKLQAQANGLQLNARENIQRLFFHKMCDAIAQKRRDLIMKSKVLALTRQNNLRMYAVRFAHWKSICA